MKAKTIVGLMACAVLAPAFADTINNNNPTVEDWFSSGVANKTISTSNASWGESAPGLNTAQTAFEIDADAASPATLTPTKDGNNKTAADLASDGLVTITSKAYLAPSAIADQPTAATLGNAQVGFAVFTTTGETPTSSYYVYVRTGATEGASPESTGEWIAVTGTGVEVPSGETDTEFKIELDYRSATKVAKFYVKVGENYVQLSGIPAGGTATDAFEFVPADSKLSDIAALGSGTITSIDAKYEKAVAAVAGSNVPYATVAAAYAAAGASGTVVAWNSTTGAPAAADSSANYAANGLTKPVCMALNLPTDVADAKLSFQPAATQPADGIAVATTVAPVTGVNVKFVVNRVSGTEATGTEYDYNAIKLPLGTGTYTIVPSVSAAN